MLPESRKQYNIWGFFYKIILKIFSFVLSDGNKVVLCIILYSFVLLKIFHDKKQSQINKNKTYTESYLFLPFLFPSSLIWTIVIISQGCSPHSNRNKSFKTYLRSCYPSASKPSNDFLSHLETKQISFLSWPLVIFLDSSLILTVYQFAHFSPVSLASCVSWIYQESPSLRFLYLLIGLLECSSPWHPWGSFCNFHWVFDEVASYSGCLTWLMIINFHSYFFPQLYHLVLIVSQIPFLDTRILASCGQGCSYLPYSLSYS